MAFAEDESRIMSLSCDGVVIIRDININKDEQSGKNQFSKYPFSSEVNN